MRTWTTLGTGLLAGSLLLLGGAPQPAGAATIVGFEVRGGGCLQPTCAVDFDLPPGDLVALGKRFLRTPETGEDELEHSGGGNRGGRDGMIGPPRMGEGEDHEEEHDEEFERLPPINIFLTLQNSGGADAYLFQEEVRNETTLAWPGFFHALRRNELGLAAFGTSVLGSDVFENVEAAPSHEDPDGAPVTLEWTGGPLGDGETGVFEYEIAFQDCEPGVSCSDQLAGGPDGFDGYVINLQQFPLVPAEVPEPGELALLGVGAGLLVAARRRRARGG